MTDRPSAAASRGRPTRHRGSASDRRATGRRAGARKTLGLVAVLGCLGAVALPATAAVAGPATPAGVGTPVGRATPAGVGTPVGRATPAGVGAPAAPARNTSGAGVRAPRDEGCLIVDPRTQKCIKPVHIPGTPGNSNDPHDPHQGNGDQGNDKPFTGCLWEPVSKRYPGSDPPRPAGVSPNAVYSQCVPYLNGVAGYCPCVVQWIEPGNQPQVTPQQVAQSIDVEALLHAPDVSTNPPQGTPALVDTAVFAWVTNWPDGGKVSKNGCIGAVCVTIQAEPKLTFDPGDGSGTIACEPGGTRYNPAGPPPKAQAAAAGACAHIYTRRTGVSGRPAAWPASLTITWTVTWQGAGQTGTFDPVTQTTGFTVDIDEVQGVVTRSGA